MARKTPPTSADLAELMDRAADLAADFQDMADRIRENGYADDVTEPVKTVRHFAGISRASSHLTHCMLVRMEMEEDRAALEKRLRG